MATSSQWLSWHPRKPKWGRSVSAARPLDVKAGQEYFLRVEIATGFAKGHGRLVLMSAEQGGYELKSSKLKPLDSKKVVNATLVSVGEYSETPAATAKPAVLVESH